MSPIIGLDRHVDFRARVAPSVEAPVSLPYELRTEMTWLDFSHPTNPLGTPKSIIQAMHSALVDGELSFAPDSDGHEFRNALARPLGVEADWILCGSSTHSLINAAACAYKPCSVGIVVPSPSQYVNDICNAGHTYVELKNPLSYAVIDSFAARKQCGRFNAALLANPTYPGSRLLSPQTLTHYLETCSWVIVDESFIDLSFGGESIVDMCAHYRNLIVVRSLSTTFNMPGTPISFLVAHPDTVLRIKQFYDGNDISMFAEVLAKQFVSLSDYIDQTHDFLDSEIPWFQCQLNLLPGIRISPAEGNFVLCDIDLSGDLRLGVSCADELVVRLQLAGFLARRLTGFSGIEGDTSFCVAVRSRSDNIRLLEALKRILTTIG